MNNQETNEGAVNWLKQGPDFRDIERQSLADGLLDRARNRHSGNGALPLDQLPIFVNFGGFLGEKKRQILVMISNGVETLEEIERAFGYPSDIEDHLEEVIDWLDVQTVREAVERAAELGLLVEPIVKMPYQPPRIHSY